MKRRSILKRLLKLAGFLCLSLLLALIITFVLHWPSMKIVAQWSQPVNLKYGSFDPYYLSVVESDIDWRTFPFGSERNYFIYVGREKEDPSYGHWVNFSFHAGYEDIETFIKKSDIKWSNKGVTFATASGHTVFIPKKMFIGGR